MTYEGKKRADHGVWIDGTNCPRRESSYFKQMDDGQVTASVITSPHWYSGFQTGVREVVGDNLWVRDEGDGVVLATKAEQIRTAHADGKRAIVLAPQDGKIIEDYIEYLHVFHALGVRILELTHMYRNFIGDGTIDGHHHGNTGLSRFGLSVVKEMNRLGMVIDVAHSGSQTTLDAIRASEAPVIFSHANVHALCDNIRNKRDDEIEALAERGGVIGLTAYAQFCETERGVWPSLEDFCDHVDYVVQLVGIDHVGVSLDIDEVGYPEQLVRGLTYESDTWDEFKEQYAGMTRPPYDKWVPPNGYPLVKGMEDLTCFPVIASTLEGRGYSPDEIDKVMGGNWLRVYETVWGG